MHVQVFSRFLSFLHIVLKQLNEIYYPKWKKQDPKYASVPEKEKVGLEMVAQLILWDVSILMEFREADRISRWSPLHCPSIRCLVLPK